MYIEPLSSILRTLACWMWALPCWPTKPAISWPAAKCPSAWEINIPTSFRTRCGICGCDAHDAPKTKRLGTRWKTWPCGNLVILLKSKDVESLWLLTVPQFFWFHFIQICCFPPWPPLSRWCRRRMDTSPWPWATTPPLSDSSRWLSRCWNSWGQPKGGMVKHG